MRSRTTQTHRHQHTPSATKYHIRLSADTGSQREMTPPPAYYAGLGISRVRSRRHRWNHQRGYFDIAIAQNTGVRKTSTRSPLATRSNMHFSSCPP
ncbi:hypothetical protein A0H81_02269 [Grifola frondosa]|uniref:Uncharacterized protein n=1 Tax=Grifola frondosa TaxID=5627 RepID=A0A1C7MNS1_GRIFR|nr:hypothetical protein A0H81_02269 [Grifola frondosa]